MPRKIPQTITLPPPACVLPAVVARTQEEQVAVVSLEPTYYLYADEEPQKELKDFVQKIFFFSHSWLQYTEDNRVVYNRDDDNEKDSEEPSYYEAFMDEADDITVNEDEEEHSYNYAYLDDSDIDLDDDNEEDGEEPSYYETSMDESDNIAVDEDEEEEDGEESSSHETSVDESDNIPVRSSRPLGRWARFTRVIRGLLCCCKPRISDDNG
ncbi:probable DNA-directed RNA polymerase subunit delta [Eleutherodactylus coqui]|uniref:probable DNA-directed RNA polymerase subunit delta n=1 Tax=Eleutherodactylus coqui TaxID=57060 RepID=UPI003463290B